MTKIHDSERNRHSNTGKGFEGEIPPIAEKEKRGKRIKVPKNEIYVQELQTKTGINHGNN